MSTSQPIGTNPHARKRRGATGRSRPRPAPSTTRRRERGPSPARISRRPAPADGVVGVEELDRELPPVDETAAEDGEAVVGAEHLDVAPVADRAAHPGVIELIVAPLERAGRVRAALCREDHVDRTDAAVLAGEPAEHARGQRPAEAARSRVGLSCRDTCRIDIGEDVGVSGERHHGERPVSVRRQISPPRPPRETHRPWHDREQQRAGGARRPTIRNRPVLRADRCRDRQVVI